MNVKPPLADLGLIASIAKEKQITNMAFADYLKSLDSEWVDQHVQELDVEISAAIDCTKCGNCCRSLMINVNEKEADELAAYLHTERSDFDKQYIENGNNGMMLINQIPCHFLNNNMCNVYEHRFEGCREFPGLQLPGFTKRLFSVFMHYDRCPIIFNVTEVLKQRTGFKQD
jgi:hypothetical protein